MDEAWLRGPMAGIDPLLMPVAHALVQVREDVTRLAREVPPHDAWQRPGGAASIGFHLRHIGGALDRLFTYARGETLSDEQRAALRMEGTPGEPPASLVAVADDVALLIDRALDQLRATSSGELTVPRRVGRAGLPSTVIGLLFHAAEHSTRHAGQAITTARILAAGTPG
ncbi:MAG TPA: DinB family protein [Vicinamibacterales bacterium]